MRKILFVLLVVASGAAPAAANPRVEVGVAFGGHTFSDQVELGVTDDMLEPGPRSGIMLGARVALPFTSRLAAEGEAMLIPTKDDVLGDKATVYGLRAHLRFDLLTGKIKPFVVAGVGAHVLRSTSPQMDNDADRAYHWGGGVRFAVSDKLEARIDARHLIVPDRTLDGATSDFEFTAGVTYRFGTAPRPVVVAVVAPPPEEPAPVVDPVDPDPDHDGLIGSYDACPDDPETRNGWKDEDGCPDQVIQELAGIGFELDSAQIDSGSTPILEHAFQILKENPNISVEISGHTSSEGDPDRNLALSLARAEAVKEYLVRRGIAAARILTVGHGSEVPIADNASDDGRRKNRRIEFRILTPADVK